MSDAFKSTLKDLVKKVKNNTGLTQEEIAGRLRYTRTYLSDLISQKSRTKVDQTHIDLFAEVFKDELVGNQTMKRKKAQDDSPELTEVLKKYTQLLEEKNLRLEQEISLLKIDNENHYAHISALRKFVLQLAQEVRGGDYKSQSVKLGKLEGEEFRLGDDTYIDLRENANRLRKKTGTVKAD